MITVTDCVNAVEQFLRDEGFVVDRCFSSITVDLKYGEYSHEYTTLGVDVDDYIGVYAPGTAAVLRVPLAQPDSFDLLANVIRAVHAELLERGIDEMWRREWKYILGKKPPVYTSCNPCGEL